MFDMVIREMQNKFVWDFAHTVRIATMNKKQYQFMLVSMESKGDTHLVLVGVPTCTATTEMSVVVLQEDGN